jgi:hypothetical protein
VVGRLTGLQGARVDAGHVTPTDWFRQAGYPTDPSAQTPIRARLGAPVRVDAMLDLQTATSARSGEFTLFDMEPND